MSDGQGNLITVSIIVKRRYEKSFFANESDSESDSDESGDDYDHFQASQNGYGTLAPYNFGSRYGSYCVMGSKQVALQLRNAASTLAAQSSIHFSCSK